MTSSHVNKAIQNIWNKGPVKKAITATRIRKSTATHVRQECPSSRETLARHMTHSTITADRHYALINARNNALEMTKLISSVMVPKRAKIIELPDNADVDTVTTTQPDESVNTSAKIDDKEITDVPITKCPKQMKIESSIHWPKVPRDELDENLTEDKRDDVEVQNELEIEDDTESKEEDYREILDDLINVEIEKPQTETHKRRSFSTEESTELLQICEDLIAQENVSIVTILDCMQRADRGIELLDLFQRKFGKGYLKKIYDRLRCELRRRKRLTKD